MNARCNNESVLLFEKLSHFPLRLVHKHLNASSLFLNALLFEKWEALIKNDGMRMESTWNIKMTHNEVWIQLELKNKKNENLVVCFKEDSESKMKMAEDVRVHQENNLVTFFHKTNEHIKASCFKALQLLKFLFPPTYYRNINLSLGPRSPEFPFRLLLQLPRGTAYSIGLHADQEVEGADLVNFLRNFKVNRYIFGIKYPLDISARIKNLVKSDELGFSNVSARISDARFLSNNFIKKFTFTTSELGQNDFTSQDFNAFLQSWMNSRGSYSPARASFDIREDQKIKMEEVMEGLNPHVGMPRIRDRWKFDYPAGVFGNLYPSAIDMADGWDIQNSQGGIGTVLLEPSRLTFAAWPSSSPWQCYVQSMDCSIASFTLGIELLNQKRERIQKKVDAGKMELFPPQVAYLEEYPERMRTEQARLALACEVKEKLLTVWKNDDTVYVPPPPHPWENSSQASCTRTILIFGSSNVALDGIPLSMQLSMQSIFGGQTVYTKRHGKIEIRMFLVTDIASIKKNQLRNMNAVIYAYSDSDSFDHLATLFISLRKIFGSVLSYPIRQASSMLLHLPGSDQEGRDQPDQFDVENFQRNTWSDQYEFDPYSDSPIDSDIRDFVEPTM